MGVGCSEHCCECAFFGSQCCELHEAMLISNVSLMTVDLTADRRIGPALDSCSSDAPCAAHRA
jgi:hypothetical protein